jgi:hypothetical protein
MSEKKPAGESLADNPQGNTNKTTCIQGNNA